MSIFDFVLSLSRRSNDTIDRRLLDFIVRKVAPNPNFVDGVSSSDVIVDPTRNLLFRLFIPSSNFIDIGTSLPVFVFFHGGGFAFMSLSSIQYDTLCRLFCRSFPAIIVSVNYRLAPEHRFPSQYDDGLEILKFLDKNENILGKFADITKCFLSGDSAGGNLAHHVAIQVSSENLQILKVIGLVSIQPFFGGEERTESEIRSKWAPVVSLDKTDWYWKMFLPDGSTRDHESVNVSGPNAIDILNVDYPNTLLCVGGFDPLVGWQKRYYEWLRKSGKEVELIEYPNMIHGFYCFPEIPETSHFISKIKSFMTKQMFSV
jgi:acetyl esterase/lipase